MRRITFPPCGSAAAVFRPGKVLDRSTLQRAFSGSLKSFFPHALSWFPPSRIFTPRANLWSLRFAWRPGVLTFLTYHLREELDLWGRDEQGCLPSLPLHMFDFYFTMSK